MVYKLKVNPYEMGKADALAGKPSNNPFLEFSAKWEHYNMGYNHVKFPQTA